MIQVAIHGAAGRMGRRLVALATETKGMTLGAAVERTGHELLGQDAGVVAGVAATGVKITDKLPGPVNVMIDFTAPVATRVAMDLCLANKLALVIGTTGLTEADLKRIGEISHSIPVLQAPNMSLGVNLLFALAGKVAKQLGDDYDIEIVETHHRMKVDAPSGTALGIARAICDATGKDLHKDVVHGRHGDSVLRKRGEIGMHALRSGDIVGKHTVSFGTLGEELALTHTATTRDVFARGALRAALWLADKGPGRYTMADVLGL